MSCEAELLISSVAFAANGRSSRETRKRTGTFEALDRAESIEAAEIVRPRKADDPVHGWPDPRARDERGRSAHRGADELHPRRAVGAQARDSGRHVEVEPIRAAGRREAVPAEVDRQGSIAEAGELARQRHELAVVAPVLVPEHDAGRAAPDLEAVDRHTVPRLHVHRSVARLQALVCSSRRRSAGASLEERGGDEQPEERGYAVEVHDDASQGRPKISLIETITLATCVCLRDLCFDPSWRRRAA